MSGHARVLGLALRSSPGGPMRVIDEARAPAEGWLVGDHGGTARRGVTFLAREMWQAVCRDVGVALPWWSRRANVLVEGVDLLALVGREVRVGDLRLRIEGETRPCHPMDAARPGLRRAMEPAGRGGVYARVLEGGRLHVGCPFERLPAGRRREADSGKGLHGKDGYGSRPGSGRIRSQRSRETGGMAPAISRIPRSRSGRRWPEDGMRG